VAPRLWYGQRQRAGNCLRSAGSPHLSPYPLQQWLQQPRRQSAFRYTEVSHTTLIPQTLPTGLQFDRLTSPILRQALEPVHRQYRPRGHVRRLRRKGRDRESRNQHELPTRRVRVRLQTTRHQTKHRKKPIIDVRGSHSRCKGWLVGSRLRRRSAYALLRVFVFGFDRKPHPQKLQESLDT
jgi:hypothetical protein